MHAAMAVQSWATMLSRKRSTTLSLLVPLMRKRYSCRYWRGPVGMVCGGARAAAAARVRRGVASALIAAPFALAGVAAMFAVPTVTARAEPSPQAPPPVEQTFLADCAICHGSDARGTNRGPTLVGVGRASVDFSPTTGRMPITNPARFLGNPAEETKRRKPF